MSAYLSMITPHGGFLFTDGAAYDDQGVMTAFTTKVATAKKHPFAITTMGNKFLGDRLQGFLCALVDEYGVEEFFSNALPSFLEQFAREDEWKELSAGRGFTSAHMLAFTEARGIFHMSFQTQDEPEEELTAFTLKLIEKPMAARGSAFSPDELANIRGPNPGETIAAYVQFFGVSFLERMRSKTGRSLHLKSSDVQPYHLVGGHVDMTTVDSSSARTNRVKVWDDKIGEKIQIDRQSIAPFIGMNRQQRRTAEREKRKRTAC